MQAFTHRIQQQRPILLDGATGSELNRRGVDTRLPLWSTHALLSAPDVLLQIHRDYVAAGAEVITANTFRTHGRNLAATGVSDRAADLTHQAVELARQAAKAAPADRPVWVAGSQAPLEDCYSPNLVPDDDTLLSEHRAMADNLAAAGVDVILVETQNTIREAIAATRAATDTGLPALVSFVCGADGRLLSDESISAAARAVLAFQPAALLVNCLPTNVVVPVMRELHAAAPSLPFGAYANIGRSDPVQGWVNTDAADPAVYAQHAQSWLDAGAHFVGGCCGTTPEHIRQLERLLR